MFSGSIRDICRLVYWIECIHSLVLLDSPSRAGQRVLAAFA